MRGRTGSLIPCARKSTRSGNNRCSTCCLRGPRTCRVRARIVRRAGSCRTPSPGATLGIEPDRPPNPRRRRAPDMAIVQTVSVLSVAARIQYFPWLRHFRASMREHAHQDGDEATDGRSRPRKATHHGYGRGSDRTCDPPLRVGFRRIRSRETPDRAAYPGLQSRNNASRIAQRIEPLVVLVVRGCRPQGWRRRRTARAKQRPSSGCSVGSAPLALVPGGSMLFGTLAVARIRSGVS